MRWRPLAVITGLLLSCSATAHAAHYRRPIVVHKVVHLDHSGHAQRGRASYYAHRFDNHRMANGKRFNPNANIAASTTLPLGTTAKVTNLQNGRSATVQIEDRGPWIDNRVVDVTPKVASQLDMRKCGVTAVIVAPITVPQPDGAVKLGAGAADASAEELQKATEQTAAATQ
jgi:rare lipoprotein A